MECPLGIGDGYAQGETVRVKQVVIINGQINATGSSGAGIWSGFGRNGNSTVDSMTIEGGTISVQAENASVIGSGYSHVEKLLRVAGTYNITAKGGAGIGSGYADGGNSTVESVQILPGTYPIRSDGGAGIGSGLQTARMLSETRTLGIRMPFR